MVASRFDALDERLDQMERRTEGNFRQAFSALAALQSQVSSMETEIRRISREVVELHRVSP